MDQSQVFRAMMPGLTGAAGAGITLAYPLFPRTLPLVRLDRRGLVFRASGAAPLVCGLPRPATLLIADEPLCSLRLVIRDVCAAGDGRHDLTMQPSGAAGDELLWHALREREPYRRIREPLAPIDRADRPRHRHRDRAGRRRTGNGCRAASVALGGVPSTQPQRRPLLRRLARISLRRVACAGAGARPAIAPQSVAAAGGRRRGRRTVRL